MKGFTRQVAVEEPETVAPALLLTVNEAAQWAEVSLYTVRGWVASGRLPSHLVDRRQRICLADLKAVQAEAHVGRVVPVWRADRRRAGKRLRALRESLGHSQLEFALAAGLTHEAISRLEVGHVAPYATTVRKLARALGVEPERFVARDTVGLTTLTTAEVAARLDVPPARVQTWLHAGLLAGVKVSGQWRIPAVVLAELERSGRLRGRSRRLDPRYRG